MDGLRVILDLRTESYSVLDDVASIFWSALIGEADADKSIEVLAERYDVDDDRLRADYIAFANRCVREGLLTRTGPWQTARAATVRRCSRSVNRSGAFWALFSLAATKFSLTRHGFGPTYQRYASLPAGRELSPLDTALSAFTRAENFWLVRRAPNDCLERSLALYRFLRFANFPAEHVIGVRRFPFAAHAWVECEGVPLLDHRARGYTVLARMGEADRTDVPA